MTSTERSGDLAIGGCFFLIGLLCIVASCAMPPGDSSMPGPGFFPGLLGLLLCTISFSLALRGFVQKTNQAVEIGNSYVWSTTVALIIVGFCLERLGFILTISLFLFVHLKKLSDLRWIACVLSAVTATIIAYVFFDLLLGFRLPNFGLLQ